jgi:hypothetical protein
MSDLPFYRVVRHYRSLRVLIDVRAGLERERGGLPCDDLKSGEEYAEALDSLDNAIVAEMLALPEDV